MSLYGRLMREALKPVYASLRGQLTESFVSLVLNLISLGELSGRVFTNLYIPTNSGNTAELDAVLVCTKGIIVIECKGYRGKLLAYDQLDKWTVVYPNGSRYEMYNPIKQNSGHIKALINAVRGGLDKPIGKNIPVISFIVFSNECDITGIIRKEHDAEVVNFGKLNAKLKQRLSEKNDILTEADIELISGILKKFEGADEKTKREHLEYVDKMKKQGRSAEILEHKCPVCGKNLIVRTVRNGSNAGKQFIGCTGYPECKYIMDFKTMGRGKV